MDPDLFRDPPVEFRPIPFWFWNSELEEDEIKRQIEMMSEAGLGGFFIHARFGLETEYMSDEWLRLVRAAVETAERLGMKAWLYDEYPFPSGIGGLRVTSKPELRNKFLDLFEWEIEGGGFELEMARPGEFADHIKTIVALALPIDTPLSIESIRGEAISLEAEGKTLKGELPHGRWRVIAIPVRRLSDPGGRVFGPDYLNPETTRLFLSILDRYAEAIGDRFGETVPGIFTDEPCLLAWHQGHTCYRVHHDGRLAVWSEALEERLREELERREFSLEELVLSVFYELGEEGRELRELYRRCVAELYVESFFKPYSEWCRRHNLKLTGHLLLEEGLYSNLIFQGDIFADLSFFDIPGVDHLGAGCEGRYGGWGNLPLMSTNVQGYKIVSSAAHLFGKEAVLSESFGVSGWRLSMADMKRVVDWQFRLGVNLLCPHAFYYSLEGFRKTDSPPSQFYHATYWRHYRLFADYVARLSLALRAGVHVAKIGLIYPLRDFSREMIPGQQGRFDKLMSDYFNFLCSELLKCHYDYDVIPDRLLRVENVRDGRLRLGDEEYEAIIVPPVRSLPEGAVEALIEMYEGGGGVMASELSGELVERLKAVKGAKGRLVLLPKEISFAELKARLPSMLETLVDPDIRISSREVGYIHRRDGDLDIYFLASDSEKPVEVEVEIPLEGRVEHWDAESGGISEVPAETGGGWTRFRWRFEPFESALFVIRRGRSPGRAESRVKHEELKLIEVLDGEWEFEMEGDNCLPLERWGLSMSVRGDWTVYEYKATFKADFIPSSLKLLLDDVENRRAFMEGTGFELHVNGVRVEGGFERFVDPGWRVVEIGPMAHRGENEVKLRFVNQGWSGEPKGLTYPPKLLGKFSLRREGDEYVIAPPPRSMRIGRSWTDEGMPFYSGACLYRRRVRLPKSEGRVFIEAEGVADMAEFLIDERVISVRPWPPFVAEVELDGRDELTVGIRVINSPANFIDSDPKPSGILGTVKVWG